MEIDRQTSANTVTLTLRGRLDAAWSLPVADALQKAVRDGFLDLRLELSGITYISSAGLRVLLSHWKELRRAQGRLSITRVSEEVERVLRLAGLGSLLDPGGVTPPIHPVGESKLKNWNGKSFSGEIEDLAPNARWRGRLIGAMNGSLNLAGIATGKLESLKLPASTLALGFGALGNSDTETHSRVGELLAAGGCAVHLPSNGENQADYAVTQGALAPEARIAQGLVAEGAFSKLARFEVAADFTTVSLPDLAVGLLAASDAPQIAFAAIVESAALVGACLRRAPNAPGVENIFAFPAVRDWLTFTAEPAYQNTVALIVGVAARSGAASLADFTRSCGPNGSPLLHAHAAAFPFRPVRHGRLALAETAAGLFDHGRVLGVLHLLPDHRPGLGAGESCFYRGACWFGPLDIQ